MGVVGEVWLQEPVAGVVLGLIVGLFPDEQNIKASIIYDAFSHWIIQAVNITCIV